MITKAPQKIFVIFAFNLHWIVVAKSLGAAKKMLWYKYKIRKEDITDNDPLNQKVKEYDFKEGAVFGVNAIRTWFIYGEEKNQNKS